MLSSRETVGQSWMFPPPSFLQACRHFNDSSVCKENCPPPTIYDPVSFQTKPNPNKKFNFGATCVKTCPCKNMKQKWMGNIFFVDPKWRSVCSTSGCAVAQTECLIRRRLDSCGFIEILLQVFILNVLWTLPPSPQITIWLWKWPVLWYVHVPTRKLSSPSLTELKHRNVKSVKENVRQVCFGNIQRLPRFNFSLISCRCTPTE